VTAIVSTVDRIRVLVMDILPRTGMRAALGDSDVLAAAGIDSMRLMMLISALQLNFAITVEEEDLRDENFASVEALARFVTAKGGA
jgi:acyl carrier protein